MQVVCAFMNHLNSESHNRIFFVEDFPVISNCVVLCLCMYVYMWVHMSVPGVFTCVCEKGTQRTISDIII